MMKNVDKIEVHMLNMLYFYIARLLEELTGMIYLIV